MFYSVLDLIVSFSFFASLHFFIVAILFPLIVQYIVSDSSSAKEIMASSISFHRSLRVLEFGNSILHSFVTVAVFVVVVVRFVVACAFFRKIYFYCCKTEWVGMGRFLNRIENIVGHTLPASYPLTVCGESVHIVHRYVVKVRKYL